MKVSSASLICLRTYGGRGILAASLQANQISSVRQSSDDVKFLTRTDLSSLKKGRGGRSSFSGIVATIFGATGFMGRYVVNKLGKTGTQMIIPHRCDGYDVMHLKTAGDLGQILFQDYDYLTEDNIRKAIKHSDVVINLIGRDFASRNFSYMQANADVPVRIAKVCKEMGTEKFIHVSALNSDREHQGYLTPGGSQYLQAKGEGERRVRDAFPEAIIFRPSDCYGIEDRFLRYLARGPRRLYSHWMFVPYNGKGIWKQPVFIADVAQGIVNSIKIHSAVGTTYDAAGPRKYELDELIDWMNRVMRRDNPLWGYKRFDMKWNPFIGIAAKVAERFTFTTPVGYFTSDRIEREVVSDITTDLPNLTDLGVKLTHLEDRMKFELQCHMAFPYYHESAGEYAEPAPAKYIEAH